VGGGLKRGRRRHAEGEGEGGSGSGREEVMKLGIVMDVVMDGWKN
jgi:hypothetical protein